MKPTSKLWMNIWVLLLGIFACRFPRTTPPPLVFPTPNLTATELLKAIKVTPESTKASTLPTSGTGETLTPITAPSETTTSTPEPPVQVEMHRDLIMQAVYMEIRPSIDGVLSEWDSQTFMVNHLVYGQSNYQGGGDLSATVRMGWDEAYFYLAIEVMDDNYVQNAHGNQIFKGDSIEVLLDASLQQDFSESRLNVDDYQLGLSLGTNTNGGTDEKENYLWFPRELEGSKADVLINGGQEENGYRAEAAIPWEIFDVHSYAGLRTGFAISVSDNDNPRENVQESMVSAVPTRQLTDPTSWGELVLVHP